MDIQKVTEQVERENTTIKQMMVELEKVIVGQKGLIENLLIGLLCDGHLLLEGLPGLAWKTEQLQYIDDVTGVERFLRRHVFCEVGLVRAVALPVWKAVTSAPLWSSSGLLEPCPQSPFE